MCGTYINRNKIVANKPRVLNNGDLVGVGCPEERSSRSEKLEKFVFKIRALEAYKAPLRQVELEHDCPTPPPQHEEEDMEIAPSNNLPDVVPEDKSSQESPERPLAQASSNPVLLEPRKEVFTEDGASDKGSPVIPSSKKKRVKRLLSSSEEDDDEVKEIKNFAKRLKSKSEAEPFHPIKSFNRRLHREVSVRVPILKIPKRAVSAKVGSENKIIEWAILSSSDYKKVTRAWAGRYPDGSQGTPLFQALKPDDPEDEEDDGLSDVSSGEIPVTKEAEEEVIDMDLSSISSDEEAMKVTAETPKSDSELVKITYGANLNSKPIIVKAEPQQHFMNYSMNDDATVITFR